MSNVETMHPCVLLSDIYKTYNPHARNQVEVLKGAHLEIYPGDIVAIMGASGVGKSTLLHIMGALDRPTSGRLLYGDLDVSKMNDVELARFRNRTIGFVFQFHHLLPEFSAIENTMMPALIAGLSRVEARSMAGELLAKVGLDQRMPHKPGELSGGEQQRVALARALIMRPKILLADEPTGNLDARTGDQIMDIIRDLNAKESLTTVLVTHNSAIAQTARRRVMIEEGVVREI